jgi:hypothetical protein
MTGVLREVISGAAVFRVRNAREKCVCPPPY